MVEQLSYTGQALRVVGWDTAMVVLVMQNEEILHEILVYVPNDDSDSDGVLNTVGRVPAGSRGFGRHRS